MLYHAKSGTIPFPDSDMQYIRFGNGKKNLVMLPGLGDGLRTVGGLALPTALLYRLYARDYTVYMFSRKNILPPGYTTRDMARDQMRAMDALGIRSADVLGVSMGGMIAQHLAADYPEAVDKLVLVVTAAQPNELITDSVTHWMDQARQGDHEGLMESNLRLIYSDAYYNKNRKLLPLTAKLSKPQSYDRFLVQAQACLTHDAFYRLGRIYCPTLVIGGEEDKVVGGQASRELMKGLFHGRLVMYPYLGHGLYEEAKDFNRIVLKFLREA